MLISVQRPWRAPGVHVACDAAWRCEGGKWLSGGTFDGRMPVRICSVHFGRSAPSRRRWVLSTRIRAASVQLGLAVRPVPAFAAGRLVRDCVRSWGQLCLQPGARRCSPGPGRLQLHVVRRRGQAVAVLLMSLLGRSGRRKESGLRPWLAAEPRVVATRSCRCCSGNRRRVHSRPAWNCSCWGRCGAWALKQSGSSRRVSLRPAGMRRRFGLPGLPGVLRSMSLRFPSVGGGRAEMRQWARIRSRGPPAEGVGSSVR